MRVVELFSKDGQKNLTVAVIGTCRLDRPINELVSTDQAKILWDHSGFSHSIQDALQWISLLNQETAIPSELEMLIYGQSSNQLSVTETKEYFANGKKFLDSADICVIEVSTKNRVHTNDFDLNSDYLTNNFVRPGGLPVLDWWSKICQGGVHSVEELDLLQNSNSELEKAFPNFLNIILSQCRRTIGTNIDVLNGIKLLKEKIPKCECVIIANPDPLNMNLASFLAHESNENHTFRFLDPNSLIKNFELSNVFKGEGTDFNHYNESFELTMGEYLRDFICLKEEISGTPKEYFRKDFIRARIADPESKYILFRDRNISFDLPDKESITLEVQGEFINLMGWFRFSFEIADEAILDQSNVVLKDSNSQEWLNMHEDESDGNKLLHCTIWLDRREAFFFHILVNPTPRSKLDLMNFKLEPFDDSFPKPIFSVQESMNSFNPSVKVLNDTICEIDLPDLTKSNGTGGITVPEISVGDTPQIEIHLELRSTSKEGVGIRLFNGHNWTSELAVVGTEFKKILISEQIDNCTQQKPRLNFFNYSKGTKIQIKNYSVTKRE